MQAALQTREEIESYSFPLSLFQGSGTFSSIHGQIQTRLKNDKAERAYITKVAGELAHQWREMSVAAFSGEAEQLLDTAADMEEGCQSLHTKVINGRSIMVAVGPVQDGAQSEIQRILSKLAFFQSLLKIAELLIPGLADVLGKAGVSQQAALQRIQEIAKPFEELQRLVKAGIKTDAQRQTVTNLIEKLSEKLHRLGSLPGLKGIAERMMREVRELVKSPVLGLSPQTQARLTRILTPRTAEKPAQKQTRDTKIDTKTDPKAIVDLKSRPSQPSRTFLVNALKTPNILPLQNRTSLSPATVRASIAPRGGILPLSRANAASAATRQSHSSLASQASHKAAAASSPVAGSATMASAAPAQTVIGQAALASQAESTAPASQIAPTSAKDASPAPLAAAPQVIQQQESIKEQIVAPPSQPIIENKLTVNEQPRVENLPPARQETVVEPVKLVQADLPKQDNPVNLQPVQGLPAQPAPVEPVNGQPPSGTDKTQPGDPKEQIREDRTPRPEDKFQEAKKEATAPKEEKQENTNAINEAKQDLPPQEARKVEIEKELEKVMKENPTFTPIQATEFIIEKHTEDRPAERGTPAHKAWVEKLGNLLEVKLAQEAKEEKTAVPKGTPVAARPGCPPGCGGGICPTCN